MRHCHTSRTVWMLAGDDLQSCTCQVWAGPRWETRHQKQIRLFSLITLTLFSAVMQLRILLPCRPQTLHNSLGVDTRRRDNCHITCGLFAVRTAYDKWPNDLRGRAGLATSLLWLRWKADAGGACLKSRSTSDICFRKCANISE